MVEAAHPQIDLMRRAGQAAAAFLMMRTAVDARIVVFVGPGNNGGDALACAVELAQAGYAPVVVLLGDPAKFGVDAARAWRRVVELQGLSSTTGSAPTPPEGDAASVSPEGSGGGAGHIRVLREIPRAITADWIVDGLFGIGLKRPLDGAYSDAVNAMLTARQAGAQVLALDVPSGIDADTGALVGDAVVAADHTLTFIAIKPGLVTGPAMDFVGQLQVESLGIDVSHGFSGEAVALDASYLTATQKHSPVNAHKGTHGTCVILGGATGMLGAALLASRAAMRCGAGKVKLGWLANPAPQVDPQMPEVMMATAAVLVDTACDSMVVGCGLGVSGGAVRLLRAALRRDVPMVVDADALNLIAQSADLATLLQKRTAATIITPHPAEAARLLGCSTAMVQADRLRAARDLARGYRCIAVLKGAGTVVCDGATLTVNRTGNPLLATAGTGDVLAGMIGALLAQAYDAATAARRGVCMHGMAADALRAKGIKRAVAGDVIDELRFL
jgi:ADP-dependent NAD(P)H-hydrate dehydratase / NAD(P)H-hydrate epimerase